MIQCKTCGSDVRECPVCDTPLNQDVHGTWFHNNHGLSDIGDKGCPWNRVHLDDAQLEYLAKTKTGYIPKRHTSCNACHHFVGFKTPNYNWHPCGHPDGFVIQEILHVLARRHQCPVFEPPKRDERKEK